MNIAQRLLGSLLAALPLLACSAESGLVDEAEPESISEAVTPAPAFPLRISGNAHYLEGQNGTPFLWLGDSAWTAPQSLTPSEMDLYLDNRNAKGFTAVVAELINTKFTKSPPNDAAGHPPFTATLSPGVFDMSKPSSAYFDTVDVFVQKAAARGMVVLLSHSYLGYAGGDEGWYTTMKANGQGRLRQWGQWLGARYKNQGNIVWLNGGDYTPPEAWVVDEPALGIRDGGATQLMTVHTGRNENGYALWGSRSWLDLTPIYTGPPTALPPLFRTEYTRTPTRPAFLVEARYENNASDWTPSMLRYQAYQPYLTGGMGQMFGNEPIWCAGGTCPGVQPFSWQTALDMQGSQDMARLAGVLSSRQWWKLVPDSAHTVLTSGYGSGLGEIVAARANDGSFALAYVPSTGTGSNTFTIAMNQLSSAVNAQWFNPTSGSYSTVAGSPFANSGSRSFTTPGNNGTNTNDWLLVLTAGASAPVLTSISVTPASASVSPGGTQAFAATAFDQFGTALSPQPSFAWTVSGGGSISSSGFFSAGNTAGGPFSVNASSGGKSGNATISVTTPAPSQTLSAQADAYVRDGASAAQNFGTASELMVKTEAAGWNRHSYLKFDLSSIGSSITSARLRLFGSVDTSEQVAVAAYGVSNTSWSESTLTWNNKPAAGTSALATVTVSGSADAWFEWDVTAYVKAEKAAGRNVVTLALIAPSTNSTPPSFDSREASNGPQLAVNASGTEPPQPPANQPPSITTAAAASPSPVTTTSTTLSVAASDDGGEANLTYAWATTGTPPAPVMFSSTTGKSVTATFGKAGAYSLRATVTDQGGLSVTSNVNVTVNQTLGSVSVTPGTASVSTSGTQQFSATASDQFGTVLASQPTFSWSVSGGGTIGSGGLFTASGSAGGPFTVSAATAGKSGTAAVSVVASPSVLTLSATEDAYVRDGDYANTSFGTETDLLVKNELAGWNRLSYLKFDLGSMTRAASSVKLRLFGSIEAGSQVPVQVFGATSTSWLESSLTWNNRPVTSGSALAQLTVASATPIWYEWDLTTYINAEWTAGRRIVTLVLVSPSQNAKPPTFNSDEAPSDRPQLRLNFG
jgi:hypothetical protein